MMDRYAIGRFAILILLGMFTAYTLVSLFGLVIGIVLSMLVLYVYIKVINRVVDDDNGSITTYYPISTKPKANTKVKIRYRCLTCYHMHDKRECPRCGSRLKQAEF